MDWSKGFGATYYVSVVDPVTWKDESRIELTGGSVKKTITDLRESATINVVDYPYSLEEKWLRVYLIARQGGNSERVALFTGLATSPSKNINGNLATNDLECYSVLKPAEDVLLQRGWYAPAYADGPKIIRDMLKVIPAPVVIDDNADDKNRELKNAIIAEDGESCLTMADKVLTAINWRLVISGDGTVTITDPAKDISATLSALNYDIVEPKVSVTNDWYTCPNVFRAVMDDTYALARDDEPDSILSVPSRGREIWMEETNCDLNTDETLAEYAYRRLQEEQRVATTLSYDRRYDPSLNPTDIVRLSYPGQEIDGVYLITSQSIELAYGARVSEEVSTA